MRTVRAWLGIRRPNASHPGRSDLVWNTGLAVSIAITLDLCHNLSVTPDELADAKRNLRVFAAANEMQWVLDQVDEAISLGVAEIRTMRQSIRQGREEYMAVLTDEILIPGRRRRRKRSEEFVSRRPMTDLEQINLLIDALGRVLVDLNQVAKATIESVNDSSILAQPENAPVVNVHVDQGLASTPRLIHSVSFVPEEEDNSPAISSDLIDEETGSRALGILNRIRNEIGL
jgi:hypothetical protein